MTTIDPPLGTMPAPRSPAALAWAVHDVWVVMGRHLRHVRRVPQMLFFSSVQPLVFMVGLGTAAAFVASIALPPLIARDESEASTYSAVMYTAGYLLAFVGPLSAGMLVDATGSVALAFWPPVAGAVLMAVVGSLAPRLLSRSRVAVAK